MHNDHPVTSHCQVCNRVIRLKFGVIWHHGFRRPGLGWQSPSCFGAMYPEYAVSRERLGEWIVQLGLKIRDHKDWHGRVEREETAVSLTAILPDGTKVHHQVTRENCAEIQALMAKPQPWVKVKEQHMAHIEGEMLAMAREGEWCQKRYDEWCPPKARA